MDYIDRRRAELERRLGLISRQYRHRASRAWVLRDRLATMLFADLKRVSELARAVEDSAGNAATLRRFMDRFHAMLDAADAERGAGADVDGSCRFLTAHGRCGRPTVEGSRWCADHVDEWAGDGRHAAGVWRRLLLVRMRDVIVVTRPETMSEAGILKTAREAAELLESGSPLAGGWTREEARRWAVMPDLRGEGGCHG